MESDHVRKSESGKSSTSRVFVGWRKWAVRLLMTILAPALFLVLLEGALLLFGYGYSTKFFVESDTADTYIHNEKFSWRFYRTELSKEPLPFSITTPKPKGVFRIFVLGSSAAWGTPSPSFSFPRILSVMLRQRFPDTKFEVINTAIMGVNSHIVLPIARDCADHEPDLFIVYLGNNEIIGLHGPKTHPSGKMPSLAFIRAGLWVKTTRTGQLVASLTGGSDSPGDARKSQDLEYFRKHSAAFDDPDRIAALANFRANLEEICDVAHNSGAATLVATVAVNLKDSPPFVSLHRADLAGADLASWNTAYDAAITAERFQRHPEALAGYLAALKIDDKFADLHFRLGRLYLAMGRIEEARKHYSLARDHDAMAGRADSRINECIRQTASSMGSQDVELVDAAGQMARSDLCDNGIPGANLFYEHVHMKFAGNYELARAMLPSVARAVARRRPDQREIKTAAVSMQQCADALGLSKFRLAGMLASIVKLTSRPPFTGQIDHRQRQRKAARELADLRASITEADLKHAVDVDRKAIAAWPDDWLLHMNIAELHGRMRNYRDAVDHLRTVLEIFPSHSEARLGLAHALANAGENDEAMKAYQKVLLASPDDAAAHLGLGVVLAKAGKFDRAIHHINESLRIKPDNESARRELETVKRIMAEK